MLSLVRINFVVAYRNLDVQHTFGSNKSLGKNGELGKIVSYSHPHIFPLTDIVNLIFADQQTALTLAILIPPLKLQIYLFGHHSICAISY